MKICQFLGLLLTLEFFAITLSADTDVGTLDESTCSKTRTECCGEINMLLDEPTAKCFVLHENNIPKEDDKDPIKLFGFISCLVECIYTKRHYIGKNSETLNMKAVKADAENLYAARPKEKQYHVELYEFCRKEAFKLYTLIKASPAGLVIFKNSCKPYFVFVYLCQIEYHKKKTCPYFMWQGNEDDETMLSQCKAAKEQCYKIDGLTPPEQK